MALLNLTASARAVGVNRSTIVRALKSGRLSATANELGERCIDTAELMRVFGRLQSDAQPNAYADAQGLPMQASGDAQPFAQDQSELVEVLQEQLKDAKERERQALEREGRLLAMLETEQQARRELETKLLPAPMKPAPSNHRLWILLLLLLAGSGLAIWHWRELIVPYF